MSVSKVGAAHSPLTSMQYASVVRAKYANMIDKMQMDYLKPHPLGPMKPMEELSALAMPLLKMNLEKAIQISMERSIYTIDTFL